jgi:hypothetical protein
VTGNAKVVKLFHSRYRYGPQDTHLSHQFGGRSKGKSSKKYNFYISLCCPSGTLHTDESVFAFILAGNLVNFMCSRIGNPFITLYDSVCPQHLIIRVWGIVYLNTGLPEPPADKRIMLHTFFLIKSFGAWLNQTPHRYDPSTNWI